MFAVPQGQRPRFEQPRAATPGWLIGLQVLLLILGLFRRVDGRQRAATGKRGSVAADRAQAAERVGKDKRVDDAGPSGADIERARQPGRGRAARTPVDIPAKGWKDVLWRVYAEVSQDRLVAVAAGVTFYALLATFPAVAAFVSIYGLVADPATVGEHIAALDDVLPGGAVEIIGEQTRRIASQGRGALSFALVFGLAISIWSANAGVKAMMDALNVVYDEEEKRSFIGLNLVSLSFTLGAIVLLLLAIGAIVVLPVVLAYLGLGLVTEWLIWLGRWPAMLLVVVLGLAVLYRYGPTRREAKWRWVTAGSLFAGLGWIVVSILFSWYVADFGSYNETYGSLGTVIGFMTWIWLSSIVVLVGAELNAEIEHQTAEDTTRGPDKPLGTRGATMADNVGLAQTPEATKQGTTLGTHVGLREHDRREIPGGRSEGLA